MGNPCGARKPISEHWLGDGGQRYRCECVEKARGKQAARGIEVVGR